MFVTVSGYHRKSAIRIVKGDGDPATRTAVRGRRRVYDDPARQALIILWDAPDRVCGRRLRAIVPVLLPALERHGHLLLAPAARDKLISISAASMGNPPDLSGARTHSSKPSALAARMKISRIHDLRTFGGRESKS